jgi:Zn-dependent protease with chaperone function
MSRYSAGFPKRLANVMLALAAGLLVAACQTVQTTQPGVVGVDRQQRMLISSADMDKGSAEAYQNMMQEAQKKGLLNRNAAQVERVRRIANRLTPVTAAFRPDAPRWKWEVNVLTSGDVNAWCMAGGKMAVYTGLIEKLKITDDELAAVMGHEIAHALREHSREQASREVGQWLSTHPSPETRTRDLQDYAQRVMPLYQAAIKR